MGFTVLDEGRAETLNLDDDLRARPDAPLFGWKREPHGRCRGDACIPAFRTDEVDREERVIALTDAAVLRAGEAPDFTLDGWSLSKARGTSGRHGAAAGKTWRPGRSAMPP